MSAIRTMCPHCISALDLDPAHVLLTETPSPAGTGSYAFYCRRCERVTVAPVSSAAFALLVSAGVRVERARPHPPANPLTEDDVIAFHHLLDTPDWFAQLLR